MSRLCRLGVMIIGMLLALSACSDTAGSLPVVPYPQDVAFGTGSFNACGAKVRSEGLPAELRAPADSFAVLLKKASGNRSGGSAIVFHNDTTLSCEEYSIKVGRRRIDVYSSSYNGVLYAVNTLKQLMPAGIYSGEYDPEADWDITCVSIKDKPRFGYRGALLDCSRHFFSIEEIKRYLDVMSIYKLNRFHWHLTDDHGWRVEIKKYPLLTEVGSWRNGTMIGWDADSNDGIRYGGFYTHEQLRDVVAYAAERGIEIVPEIDLPAHMVSALAAYPHLGCTGGPYDLMTVWDIAKDVLCVGKDSSFDFLEDVLSEICEIFPYEYIHIGGDECPKIRWENCPHCQARIKALGLKDTDKWKAEHYLQNYVTARVQKFLAGKGKKVIGWDEILEGDLAPGATIMSWRGVEGGKQAAQKGFDAIMTPCEYCYLNYCQSDKPELEPLGFHEYVPVEKCYGYEPLEGIPEEAHKHILGVQCNVWTEFIATPAHVQYMLLPRMLAISEVQWSSPEDKDYDRFREDVMKHQFPVLKSLGYTYCKVIED
ncbi:MAG: beta-N-acetylhexosaminidase [Bacteroidales bacterium]|nr:beta-N-acetylhexosaminidase [Bacteroidales bacterium]